MLVSSYSVLCHDVMNTGLKYLSGSKWEPEKAKQAGTYYIFTFMLVNIQMIVWKVLKSFFIIINQMDLNDLDLKDIKKRWMYTCMVNVSGFVL